MWGAQAPSEGAFWGELAAAALHPRLLDGIAALDFDSLEEGLWLGSEGGVVGQMQAPSLARYSSVPAHAGPLLDVRSLGEAAVALSAGELTVHSSGGAQRLAYADEVGDLAALELEPHSGRLVLARSGGGLTLVDLKLGKPSGTVDTGGRGVVALRGPTSRGALVLGCADGCLSLADPRAGHRPEHSLPAHSGGFAALDAGGDLAATAGYTSRLGRLALDPFAKVFDVRMAPRMLSSVPFAPGPSILRMHPRFSNTLLLASAGGAFTLADAQGMSAAAMYQVETEGDMLLCAAISGSGECLAFGGSGGYVHLWAPSAEPSVNQMRQVLSVPEPPTPTVSLGEGDPLGAAPTYFPWDGGGLLSEVEAFESVAVGQPPRVVDPALLKAMKQSDFVGYIQNPHYRRGAPYGAATRAAAAQRNARVQPRPGAAELEAARAERAARRAAAGGVMLPGRYKRVAIKQQQGVRFEEFDFSYYNRTPFTGLENDLANCYTNALLQVLFFTPPTRDALLAHVPDTVTEFSLTCEMSFLFRMLATAASGTVCQAANLLRALRQSKEAAALGLLEGVKGERGASDIEVEAKKDRSLSRRVQSLSRFLLESLNKEGSVGGHASLAADIYGLVQRQRTQCLSRPGRPDQVREALVFQVDLQYPQPKDRPAGGTAGGTAGAAGGAAPPAPADAAGGASARPSFAALLQRSLKVQAEMRAWFDDEVKYQYVRQTRVPRALPQVLVVNCGLQDRADLAWWQPLATQELDGEGRPVTRRRPWLPQAVAVTADPEGWEVAVEEAGCADDLAQEADDGGGRARPGCSRAVYELTAVVALIWDEDEAEEAGPEYEGHLVAHIKVPPTYFEAQQQSPAGNTPRSLSRTLSDTDAPAGEGAMGGDGRPSSQTAAAAPADAEIAAMLLPGAGDAMAAAAAAAAAGGGDTQPQPPAAAVVGAAPDPLGSPLPAQPQDGSQQGPASPPPLSRREHDVISAASDSLVAALATPPGAPAFKAPSRYNWMVFNDFHITPSLPGEVGELYGGQKLPCLLYYTQVDVVRRAAERPPRSPTPVLSQEGFLALCRMPPLQGPKVRLHKPTFSPLLLSELPQPGTLFALDAEFVAFSPPDKALRGGVEVEVRPSRLGLARVSVLRGEGPSKATACIDDYIKCAEPVYDYLTKFSGLVPGDLDPARSPHHLTTLKRAYLKLRHLVDCGAVFVGHGLKKDFRMINIVVPPSQIVDTVDLFHAKRSRKLSLRFLASYLLQASIQEHTHDSIEDAATALRLYDVYRDLVREGMFQEKLQEMYDWGKRFGWEPVVWKDGQPHPAPQPLPGATAPAAFPAGNGHGMQGRPGNGMGVQGGHGPAAHHRGVHGGLAAPRAVGRR